jgi:exodeoxyribonuclease V gamma subunit
LFGQHALDDLTEHVAELSGLARPYLVGDPERHEVVADLGSERLTGGVTRVFGDDLVRVSFSKLSARQRLQSWIELLALAVSRPERPWRAVTIGTGGLSVLGPVPSTWARAALADLVDLQRTGLAEPLPFAARTSAEYARIRRADRQIEPYLTNLERIWKQDRDELYEQFFGAGVSVADLLRIPAAPGEERGSLGEPGRLGTLARRVFHPLLSSEELG